MFASLTFRLTFIQWRFFSLMGVLAVTLALITLVLGILCRRNFGKSLPRYRKSLRAFCMATTHSRRLKSTGKNQSLTTTSVLRQHMAMRRIPRK